MSKSNELPVEYLFETSWEVCNKVGGIYTVITTKYLFAPDKFASKHIFIGPDLVRDDDTNTEFIEDVSLYKSWRLKAQEEGHRIRVGSWNIPGNPLVILVDFTSYIPRKDEILAKLWEDYSLDSISGHWDYVESVLFGCAVGRVIESFLKYNLAPGERAIAQFHEWMTGSSILYLKSKNLPLSTIFTTHATVAGRSIAGNNLPLYDSLPNINPDQIASELGVMAKHSLEKLSAHNCDIFTTVSEITANEAFKLLGREVDYITPNGFNDTLLTDKKELSKELVRERLIDLASVMSGTKVSKDALIIGIGGRYEYKNKGIDLFLESVKDLSNNKSLEREVLAFIFIPGGHNGPNRDLHNKIEYGGEYKTYTTHSLQDPDNDRIASKIRELRLLNKEGDSVKLFLVPSYLNGNDGIINLNYYTLLRGLDLTIFPSYYEPWGYTPLESLAFGVPTVTTSLAGFGLWVREKFNGEHKSIEIIEREENNSSVVVSKIVKKILEISTLTKHESQDYSANAVEVSRTALWSNQIKYYEAAYIDALNKIEQKGFKPMVQDEKDQIIYNSELSSGPKWSQVLINKQLPERLKELETISKNIWWSWNQEAIDLYESIDSDLWEVSKGNPIQLLDQITLKRYKELENNQEFLAKLDSVSHSFEEYLAQKSKMSGPSIAYFSMEFGLDKSLKIYSGGLGILAGDYLKESSDKMVKMTGIGLLYRYGYFTQRLSSHGDQVADYEPQDFMKIPVTPVRDESGNWTTITIALPGRNMYARLWRVDVGRTDLILLDTDFEDNLPEDRSVTHQLYGGDLENRLKQELLLGIGGIRALRALNITPDVYHINEGHAAFIGLERLREFISSGTLSFAEAMEVVKASSLFTTHTPVPAGHDAFGEDLLRGYLSHYPARLNMDWEALMALGKLDPKNPNEKFSMSNLAANLSQEINGVSWLHGEVSRDIFAPLWLGYLAEELHIGYVTNGVHYPTWTAPEWKAIHSKVFGKEFKSHNYDKSCFEGIYNVEDSTIWEVRTKLRKKLIKAVKASLSDPEATTHYAPGNIVQIREALRDDVLTIGFARRFATYKRAHLLFTDLERLNEIVNNPKHPVQFLFAGKAHPADKAGQDLIKRIVEVSLMPQFVGKILFLPGYDMTLAKTLVQGVDIWMNTPTRPLEASGTSGEKAVMNGVMHFSVLDGWWVEGYKEGAGWALSQNNTYQNESFQNELDAATIYNMIEDEIAPIFYDIDPQTRLSTTWIKIIKNTVSQVASNFTTNRMLGDYEQKYYHPLTERSKKLSENSYELAKELSFWKHKVRREWNHLEVLNYSKLDISKSEMLLGKDYVSEVEISIGDLEPQDLGVEILIAEQNGNKMVIKKSYDFEVVSFDKGIAKYSCTIQPEKAGVYNFAARIYAKNPNLPHRQDFDLVKWL